MNKIPNRYNWDSDLNPLEPLKLDDLVNIYIGYMFNRTFNMFKWNNLPEGITNKDMEKYTQKEGKSFWIKHDNRYYILYGSFSDFITWNQEPKKSLIVNPALSNLKNEYTIDEDVIVLQNDSNYIGLYPMMLTNAIQLAQADISLMFASFNTRFKSMFTANDDNTKDSINKLISDIWQGLKPSAVVSDDLYKNNIQGIEYNKNTNNDINSLIELKQYIKANWYIDLGINANYNMKRESLNESEMQVNDDALIPLIDDMLNVRKVFCEKVNNKYGLNISVNFSSAWKKIREEIEINMDKEKNEVSEDVKGGEDSETIKRIV